VQIEFSPKFGCAKKDKLSLFFNGEPGGARTRDPLIKSQKRPHGGNPSIDAAFREFCR
jgi:hypothetical protein